MLKMKWQQTDCTKTIKRIVIKKEQNVQVWVFQDYVATRAKPNSLPQALILSTSNLIGLEN